MIEVYKQRTLDGVDVAPPQSWLDPEDYNNILSGVDDIYTDHLLRHEEYEPGDEARYFSDLLDGAIRAYEIIYGFTIPPETRRSIHEAIEISQQAVEMHGLEEDIFKD